MLKTRQKLAITLGTAAALCLVALPSGAAVTVKNTSTYVGAGRWDWRIFVEADPDTLRQIECVEYVLHPTFPDPVRKVCNQQKTNFAYSTNGWGVYVEGAKTELDRIRCVEYTLHPTFPNPVRVVCDRPSRFELSARGWGTFTVGVKLMLKDGSVRQLTYPLEFR
jgi:transcription initiation factor IIF auxiliary subunit